MSNGGRYDDEDGNKVIINYLIILYNNMAITNAVSPTMQDDYLHSLPLMEVIKIKSITSHDEQQLMM